MFEFGYLKFHRSAGRRNQH